VKTNSFATIGAAALLVMSASAASAQDVEPLGYGDLVMEHPLRSFAFFVIAVPSVISLLAILLTAAIRSKRIPVCPSCGRPKVRPSQVTSLIDQTFRMIALAPFRCNGCLARFYAFRGKRRGLVLDRSASSQ
jgi:hypothetical protein